MIRTLVIVLLACAGCVSSNSRDCDNGFVCPEATVCATHGGELECVLPSQLSDCMDQPDETSCSIGNTPGVCSDGLCVRAGCGDGFARGAEECDGDDLRGKDTCESLGFYSGGSVRCRADCSYDETECAGICGDGVLDPAHEACDREQLGTGTDCQALGYYDAGPVTCNAACSHDDSKCTGYCGDHTKNGPELCDGAWLRPETCLTYAFDAGRIDCSSLCAPTFAGCGSIGLLPEPVPGGPGGIMYAVWASSADNVWTLTVDGGFHYDGTAWQIVDLPGEHYAMWGSAANDLWTVGYGGQIDHRDATGWMTASSPTSQILRAIWGAGAADIWAVGDGGTIIRYAGTSWQTASSPTSATLRGIWGSASNDVWAVGDAGTIVHFDGTSWSVITPSPTSANLTEVHGRGGDVWAVGSSGTLLRLAGTTWQVFTGSPTTNDLTALMVGGPDDIRVGDAAGNLWLFDGAAWTKYPLSAYPIETIWGLGLDTAWVAGEGLFTRFYGRATRNLTRPSSNVDCAWVTSPNDIWVGTLSSNVLHYDGTAWTTMASPTSGNVLGVWASGTNSAWLASGYSTGVGGVAHYNGASWSPETLPVTDTFYDLWGTSANDIWAVGGSATSGQGRVLHKDSSGWSEIGPSAPNTIFYAVHGTGPTDVWVGGDGPAGGVLYHWNGSSWTAPVVTLSIRSIWMSGTDGWAVPNYGNGHILRFTNSTWTDTTIPTTQPLRAVHGSAPDDVWVVGQGGTVLNYDGVGWAPVDLGVGGFAQLVAATRRHVYVGEFGGTVFVDLERIVPWPSACRSIETVCNDGVDEDCDGAIDGADSDCP